MLLLTDKIILHLEETFRSQYACHGCRDEFMGPMLTLLFVIIPLLVHELFDMFNKKSRIRETLNLSTNADHRTNIYIYMYFFLFFLFLLVEWRTFLLLRLIAPILY